MHINSLEFLRYDDDLSCKIYRCPLCGDEIKVHDSRFYGRCSACLATLIDYKPAPHQVAFHQSKAKFRLNIGGYGSGKTTMDAAEIVNHALSVANGRTLITAQTLQQIREAVLPELEKFLPIWFITKSTKTPLPKYTLENGHEIIIYASDDEEKIRSLNLTAFWIVEASGVDYSIFTQLQTRLRNKAAIVKDKLGFEVEHRFMGIVESNPEEGWIRDEFLLRSNKIYASKRVNSEGYNKLRTKKPEKAYHTFLSASPDNIYLPAGFIEDTCVGKTDKWINKYIYCYLEVREGVVYPEFSDCLIDPFPIPKEWLRQYGFDKGWTDETCLACGAISPDGILYIYDEYYVSEKPITYHAHQVKEKVTDEKGVQYPSYKPIQADPTVRNKNDRDGVSYRDTFYNRCGIWLEEGNNNILDGIEKVRDLMYRGKLKVFLNCVNLKEEAQAYRWKEDKGGFVKEIPVDKKNHLMDALRYLCMCLPDDLKDCYTNEYETKETILDRIKITDEDDESDIFDGNGGVYGFGMYNYD